VLPSIDGGDERSGRAGVGGRQESDEASGRRTLSSGMRARARNLR
jgi:hypothetical protein